MFTSVLMIEKPLTPADVEFVTTLHGDDRISFVVLMQPRGKRMFCYGPSTTSRSVSSTTPYGRGGARRRPGGGPAELALAHTLEALRATGAEAVGQVVEDHPLDLLRSVVEETAADEVIVLTTPHFVEEFFHRDWASRARHKVGVPVLKLFSHAADDQPQGTAGG